MTIKNYASMIVPSFLSIISITFIYYTAFYLLKKYCRKTVQKNVLLFWLAVSIIGFVIYFTIVNFREMTYVSDHTVYFDLQLELINLFDNSVVKGIAGILLSFQYSDYSYLINSILFFPFLISSKSHEVFILLYYSFLIVPTFLVLLVMASSAMKNTSEKENRAILAMFSLFLVLFPLLHFAALLGMPDVFGLFFAASIIILVINYDFNFFDISSCVLAGIFSVLLVFTRRWYAFGLAGFLVSFFAVRLFEAVLSKQCSKSFIKNYIKTTLVIAGLSSICLFPFLIYNLFSRNYSVEYSEWYLGGWMFEIKNQVGYLGILFTALLMIGAIHGVQNHDTRALSISSILGMVFTVFLFTRIQNMGKHQSLCLVPFYSVFYLDYVLFAIKVTKRKWASLLLIFAAAIILIANTLSTIFAWYDDLDGVFLLTKYAISTRFEWVFQ